MVGRLVQQQEISSLVEQDGQRQPAALAAAQAAHLLVDVIPPD